MVKSGTTRLDCSPAWYTRIIPMKPIVIDRKKSDLLPISNICRTVAPLSRLPRNT